MVNRVIARAVTVTVVGLLCLVAADSAFAGGVPRFCRVSKSSAALAASAKQGMKHSLTHTGGVLLLVNRSSVSAGKLIYARLANFSTSRVGYGLEFAIDRRLTGGWILDPSSPKGPWPKVGGILKPGRAGRCYRFKVPGEQPQGLYRFSTQIQVHLGTQQQARRTAEFRVE